MFLISLANSLPRLASTIAFLCFVVAHLEWPDIRPSSTQPRTRGPRTGGAPVDRHPPRGGTTSPSADPDGPQRSYPRPVPARHAQAPRRLGPPPRPRARG